MNVGIIGTGFGQRVVARVFRETDECEVVDVVSARDESAVAAMVARPDVDLVCVHSPPFLHAPHVRAALEHRKAVLCDKPFALDADEAADLEAEARQAGVIALCNFEFRYAPARTLLRQFIEDGELGAIEHVNVLHVSSGSRVPLRPWGWLFDRELGGGWIGAWASHAVDNLRYLFDTEVDVMNAQPRIAIVERPDADGQPRECTAEDTLTATLQLHTGATVAIDSGFAAATTLPPRFTVFGSAAMCEIVGDERVTIHRADGARDVINIPGEAGDRHLEPMRAWAVVVRDAVVSGETPAHAPTFADGRACDAVLDELRAHLPE